MNKKNNLDERQEQALLHVEKNGCWIAFWGLLAAQMIEMIVWGPEFKVIAGEWIVFMVLAIHLVSGCLRNGIWDRHLKPDWKTNLIASALAAVVFGSVMFVGAIVRYPGHTEGAASAGAISGALVFVFCIIALSIAKKAYEKKQAQLDAEPEEEL